MEQLALAAQVDEGLFGTTEIRDKTSDSVEDNMRMQIEEAIIIK